MPDFDPGSAVRKTRSAEAFIARINARRAHYGWSEFVVLEAAQRKLCGQAKEWNDSSPNVYTQFADFERELLQTFPTYTTRIDVLEEIIAQQRDTNEGLEDFCRRMIALGRRSDIAENDLAQFILNRLNYPQFTTSVACVLVHTVADLLRAVAYFEQKLHCSKQQTQPASQKHVSGNSTQPSFGSRPPTIEEFTVMAGRNQMPKCYNCRADEHTLSNCPKPKIKCNNCQRHGHLISECLSAAHPECIN